jgi:hypothetical protein
MGYKFQDVRHGKRMRQLLDQLSGNIGATTPRACQDWANTKAAYRFFSNGRVNRQNLQLRLGQKSGAPQGYDFIHQTGRKMGQVTVKQIQDNLPNQ